MRIGKQNRMLERLIERFDKKIYGGVITMDVREKLESEMRLIERMKWRQRKMKFKDFEIRPSYFLDGHTNPKRFDVVRWYKTDKPIKVTDGRTGEEKMQDSFCCSVAQIWWNDKEPCWEFKSIGTRFLEDYQEGLCEFILKWLELTDLTREFTEAKEE